MSRTDRAEQPPNITPWETGDPMGRGIYERAGRYGTKVRFIGLMDEAAMARHVVSLHNRLGQS
jgi:hypothetical protein